MIMVEVGGSIIAASRIEIVSPIRDGTNPDDWVKSFKSLTEKEKKALDYDMFPSEKVERLRRKWFFNVTTISGFMAWEVSNDKEEIEKKYKAVIDAMGKAKEALR